MQKSEVAPFLENRHRLHRILPPNGAFLSRWGLGLVHSRE
jgi:hypothetical protein